MVVGIGGGIGALLRYMIQTAFGFSLFPFGTLLVNIIGSLLLGIITSYFSNQRKGGLLYLALGTGFCGGFTTMSTFSNEALKLLKDSLVIGILYIGSTVFFGIVAGFLGIILFRKQRGEKQCL